MARREFKGLPVDVSPFAYIDYFCSQRLAEDCSADTVDGYRYRLTRFVTETGLARIEDLSPQHAMRWATMMQARGMKSGAINSMQRPVWSWFRWLHEQEFVPADISTKVKKVRPRDIARRTATADVRKLLIEVAESRTFRENRWRNVALIEMLWSTGLRADELARLMLADVDLDAGTVNVLGKGQKRRLVGVGIQARAALHAYLLRKRGMEPGALFMARRGRPLSAGAIKQALAVMSRSAGVAVSAHDFRRGCAARMRIEGADLGVVMHQLGHSSPTMTLTYSAAGETQRALAEFHAIDARRTG